MPFLLFFLSPYLLYAEEGTTTIPPSELIITGQDKYYLEWKEELPEVDLSFPLLLPPSPRSVEKEKEEIFLKIKGKEKFVIKEKPPQFLPSKNIPWIEVEIGNYNYLSSSFLFAREKRKKGGFLLIEREREDGFKWNNINDFHAQNKDKIDLFVGFPFNEGRITIPFSTINEEVSIPYENRNEKRERLNIGLGYETPFYNNLIFSSSVEREKKDIIKNMNLSTTLSFDFAKKNRLNISVCNDRIFEERNFLNIFFSFYPAKKQWKDRDVLIKSNLGLSCFKNSSTIVNPEAFCELRSLLKGAEVYLLLKNSTDFKPFSFLYFETPYSTVSKGVKPERVLELEGGIDLKKQRLLSKGSLFLSLKNDTIEWYKKAPGLYTIRNCGPLFSYGISGDINYSLNSKIDIEFLALLMGLSKGINYLPKEELEVILKYNGYLKITPKLIFKGTQKTDTSNINPFVIFNIGAERKISDEFEVFFNIENLFNNKYMKMEDYPGKRLFLSCGLKIRL